MESIISYKEHDYNSIRGILKQLGIMYPFMTVGSIGKSVAGRELMMIKIGNPREYALYVGGFHGTERLTSLLMLVFAERLLFSVKNDLMIGGVRARQAVTERGLIIIPLINPDGYEIALRGEPGCGTMAPRIRRLCGGDFSRWNANLRGVDINHNFDAGWFELSRLEKAAGIYGPSPRRFGGYSPHSEPETAALVNLCGNIPLSHAISFHSQGEVIYWNYGGDTPERSRRMAEVLAVSSGYALDIPVGLAAGGGFKDWVIEKLRLPGFTVEIGRGENPLDPAILPAIYERLSEMLMLGIIM